MCHREFFRAILFSAGLVAASNAVPEIYRWVDENGQVNFSDNRSTSHSSEAVKLRINTYESVSYDLSTVDIGKKVVMYSANWCGICTKARRYFEENGIEFTEYDVEESTKGKSDYQDMRANGVPVILVGKRRMNGFSVEGFRRLYQ
ncbi:MAG: glutaredoxin family protein [Thiohalocapsa sp.]